MTSEADTIEESLLDLSMGVLAEAPAERDDLAVDGCDLELASLAELRPVFFVAPADRADFERDDADFRLTFFAGLVPRPELRVGRALLLFFLMFPPM